MELLEPWYSIKNDATQVVSLTKELLREVGVGHPLYGLPVRAVGRRYDCDNVLYAIEDGSGGFADVHLTYTGAPERLPWPTSTRYSSFDAWLEERRTARGSRGVFHVQR